MIDEDIIRNIAMQAQYMLLGYDTNESRKIGQVLEALGEPRFSTRQENEGHIGVTWRLADLAVLVHERMQQADFKSGDHPGVFEYEITESLGTWFRNNSMCQDAEFAAELDRMVVEWLK